MSALDARAEAARRYPEAHEAGWKVEINAFTAGAAWALRAAADDIEFTWTEYADEDIIHGAERAVSRLRNLATELEGKTDER